MNIHEAKTHLSRLVDDVAKGESIIIAKAGVPVAKLVPLDTVIPRKKSLIGYMEGRVKIPDDFDTWYQEELVALFEGEE